MKFPAPSEVLLSKVGSHLVAAANDSLNNIQAKLATSHLSSSLPVAAIVAAIARLLPLIYYFASSKYFETHGSLYKITWILAFIVNVATVSMPGRFDGSAAEQATSI
jgi:hypothetical protein